MPIRKTSIAAGIALSAVAFVTLLGAEPDIPPDSAPGSIASEDTADICSFRGGLSYSKRHRATTYEMKSTVFMRDLGRIPRPSERSKYEIDHRVPLCLGGADEETNLWAQRNFHDKDEAEAYACRAVCERKLDIKYAQGCFLGDLTQLRHCLLMPSK